MTLITQRIPYLADGRIFALSAFLTLPVALFVPKAIAVLFALAALSSIVIAFAHNRRMPIPSGWGALAAAAFAILSLASALWSMTPEATMKKAVVLGIVFFAGLTFTFAARRLQGDEARLFESGLIAGGILGFSLLAIEIAFDGPIYQLLWTIKGLPPQPPSSMLKALNLGAAVAAIFLLPWTLAVWRRKGPVWAVVGFAICIAVLAFCQADSHKVALAIGTGAAVIIFIGGRPALKGVSILLVLGTLSAPWVVPLLPDPLQPNNAADSLPKSTQHRLLIWQTTSGHIFERPLLGSGFDTARAFYGLDQKVTNYFGGKNGAIRWTNHLEPIPLHPHNGILQVWLELGAAGALLLAAALYFMIGRLSAIESRFERTLLFGSFITGLVIFSISYGAWQSWWMGAIWLMIAFGAASYEAENS